MKKIFVYLSTLLCALSIFLLSPCMVVRADESNCTINITVEDVIGSYDGKMELYLRTPNEEQKKELSRGSVDKKIFTTADYGSSSVFGVSDVEGWTLVDANTLLAPEPFDTTQGATITMELYIFPTDKNEEFGEYVKMFNQGTMRESDVLSQLGIGTESSTTVTTSSPNNFDFDTWHTNAMSSFETYRDLWSKIEGDESWVSVTGAGEIRRTASKDVYSASVNKADAKSWEKMSSTEVLLWHNTYLVFCQMKDRGTDYINEKFRGTETSVNQFMVADIGINAWTGTGADEILKAYTEVVNYQIEYMKYYGMPYNFINDRSYADEIGGSFITDNKDDGKEDITEEEKQEIEEELEEDDIKSASVKNWERVFDVLKGAIVSIVILTVVFVAWLIVRHKIKQKNLDEMSDEGK